MTVAMDPMLTLAFIIVLFGARPFLLALLAIGVPLFLIYCLFRLIKWII
ncbi:MAG: hypothetical protein ACRETZ_04160 [Steroidobacteraceae bacterium]